MLLFRSKNSEIYANNRCKVFKYDVKYLQSISVSNWYKNRPPDNVRIQQIKQYYIDNRVELIPGIIYAWKHDDSLEIYDGIHRLLAGFDMFNTNNINMYLFLNVIETNKEQDIINEFVNINKSVSIPFIYLEQDNMLKRLVCFNVADYLCRTYPQFVSPSRKPHIYNFNRDNIIEFISDLNIDFTLSGIDKLIINELRGLNIKAQEFVRRNKINYPKKCDYHSFYLFYLEKSFIRHQLEMACSL